MPRRLRCASGGYVYHVLNRAVGRARLFRKQGDYAAFEQILQEAADFVPMRLLAYCLMPNHWHLVLWPKGDGDLSEYLRWLTVTHSQRWHAHHHTAGTGPIYQGRYKSFPVQEDNHYLTLCRYVERNALRAKLVTRAESWRWSSLWQRLHAPEGTLLTEGPLPLPGDWLDFVNQPQTITELEQLRLSVVRGTPFGTEVWQRRAAEALGLETTLRPRGRPRKQKS